MRSGKPVGSIFALKNMGWTDKQEIDLKASGSFQVNVIDSFTDPTGDDEADVAEDTEATE